MIENVMPPPFNAPAPQPHQLMTMSGEIYYKPGDWGERLSVGDKFTVTVFRTNAKSNPFPAMVLEQAETNPNGEFLLSLVTLGFNIKFHRVWLAVTEKVKLKAFTFDLAQLVNLQLTTQPQLIPPLIVPWGP